LVEWNISRPVNSISQLNLSDINVVVKINEERGSVTNAIKRALEEVGARELGWNGMIDLVYYFDLSGNQDLKHICIPRRC